MVRMSKIIVCVIILVIWFSAFIYPVNGDAVSWAKNQEYIDKGRDLDDSINRLGEVLVESIESRVPKIRDEDWQHFRITDKKLRLLILFNRLEVLSSFNLEEFTDPIRLEIYRRLSLAMGRAIENRPNLLKCIDILYFDVARLQAMIENTGKKIFNRDQRRELGVMQVENTVYEISLHVNPNENTISIGGKIVTIETGNMMAFSGNYNLPAKTLIDRYPKPKDIPVVDVNKVKSPGVKTEMLDVSKIYYQAPGESSPREIGTDAIVKTGGQIWFEITLPEPDGYLLAFLKDSTGRSYNLFPGTRSAVVNGDYQVPYYLENPLTSVQKTAAENNLAAGLDKNKILIGGYTFDERPGRESFYFYYTDVRNPEIERMVKNGESIGEDIPLVKTKGAKPGTTVFSKRSLYHKELGVTFTHR